MFHDTLQMQQAAHAGEVAALDARVDELKLLLKSAVTRGDGLAEQLSLSKETLAATIDRNEQHTQDTARAHAVSMISCSMC